MKTENLLPLRQPQTNDYEIRPALSFIYRLILIFLACGYMLCIRGSVCAQTLGTYPTTTVVTGQNTTVTPSAAPTSTTSIVAYTNTNFTGLLSVIPTTGVVTVTNPKQAGVYLITVKASDGALSTTTTFTLTVTNPVCSQALFEGTTDMALGGSLSVAIGDFNGDGKQDYAATSGSNTVAIRLGDGLGMFSGSTNVVVGPQISSVAIGDFNGDGKQDMAVANGRSVSVLLGDGTGGFSGSTYVNVIETASSVAIGDFNGDGKQDIAVPNGGRVSVLLGDGSGGFSSINHVGGGEDFYSVAIGDFNGDGKQDFAAANNGDNEVVVWLGNGTGGFSFGSRQVIPTRPYALAIGDFNGDGKQDFAVSNSGSNTVVSIRLGNGNGTFSSSADVAVESGFFSIAIGDFNGDGKQDIAAANLGSSSVSIRFGDGLGGFSGSTNVAVGRSPRSVAIGDFNGDGKQDFVTANQGSASASVSIRLGVGDLVWYLDADNDNYYTGSGVTQCTSPGAGYKTTGLIGGGDCNDANAAINPGATEVCNGIDDDCDGSIDEGGPAAPTGSLTIVNSSCQSNCTVTGGSIAIGSVSANGGGTLEYSINNGASWSSTLPTYNQTSSLTILASVVNAGGCRSASIAVGTTVPGTCPPDGITWTARTAAEANQWFSVTYGNGLFVAVAIGGTNQVMTSPDGITWTARTAAVANNWGSVTYGNGLFVAVAETGTNRVMTSPDGITWTARMAAEANQWWSVTYGNGLFVAVSLGGTNQVMTSPDGITWTARTAAAANQWRSLTYGNGLFVAVANTGTNRVMTSPDGITWTARTAAEANQWRSVTYGNGLFVAVSTDGINRVMTSPDGFTWSARTPAEANSSWQSVTYGNGLFVAVALNGTNRVITSPDGITWTARTAAEANLWRSLTYGNGLFVAVAQNGTIRVMTSADGLPATWYLDADNDNYYTGSSVTQCTSPGAGYKTTGLIGGGDCNDANAAVNPGATEVCNGIDDDCDGSIDENNNTTLGTYSATSLVSGANTTITPSTAPTNTTSLFAYTNTNFTGVLSADPATGVVRVTAARQAGIYPVTVLASNINGCTTTTTFTLTVTDPVCSQALFRGTATVVVQSRPLSVAIGDFDGDGKQDIAATNAGSNTVSIRLGDGNGAFSGTTNVAVQSSPQSVAIGDFNGDGKQDIAAANAGSNNVSIRLGEGNGAFSGTTNVAVQSSPRSVAIGDFNGDGRQDFATANSGVSTNTLSIRLGNGDGTFSGSTNVAVGLAPLSLAVGDFNGDGKQDIAAANSGSNTVSIRLGDGLGGFSVNPDVAVGILPQSVAIGDFNGDGKQDIVAANGSSNTVSIRLGDGAGRFSGSTDVAVDTNPISVAISDFNGDGKQDFATANTGSNTVSIRLGDGFGGFSGSTNVAIGSAPFSVAVGDFNGDGMQDFTTANQNSQTLAILLGGVNEINVQGNSTSIADGDASPTLADHTNFSSVATGSSFTRTFTIQNTGNVVLSISGISISGDNASEYVVTTAPDASVPAGGSRTFVVTFTPIAAGLRSATIRIANNDCDEAVYDFALQGTGCTNLALANSLDAATTSIVPGANHIFVSGDPCKVLVCITPNGANPVNGSVTSKVWVQPSTPTFNDRPYLLRHYEIAPATNAGTATARITLYATQADFNAFNDFQTNGNDLPAGPTDAIGIAELRIYKYSGTSSDGSGTPGSYTQPHTIIDPADADIVWNSVLNRWEISFDVVGFSGFFMGNSNGTILPLQLISFSGSKQATGNVLGWKTENEQNTRRFELERSANGSNFTRIATIAAAGAGSHRYSYTDAATQHGTVWYRLKMIDTDGKFSYSPVVIIQPAATDAITLFPNPAQNLVNISIGNRNLLNTTAQVIDAKGSLVQTIKLTGYNQQFNVGALAKGMYALKFSNGTVLRFVKE